MMMSLNRTARYAGIGIVVLILGKVGWSHRGDDWVQNLLRPSDVAKPIKFDNGSVRDAAVAPLSQASREAMNIPANNEPGKLKKCLVATKVIYTDQVCPAGAIVAPVNGGNVVVLDAQKSSVNANDKAAAQQGRKTLRDALDLSGGDDLKAKMMERAIGQ